MARISDRRASALHVSSTITSSTECLLYSATCSLSPQVTIESLSDKVLLKIFRYFLDASPRHWIRLVHICHKWRQIVFGAQRPLSLRLFCTHGTPVLETLDYWPALPIVVDYGGSLALRPPTTKDEDNIVAALKRSERVHSITLTITSSLLEKLSTLEEPFSELEDLVLLSRDSVRLTLPNTFQWGSHLRCLHLSSIAFPARFQLSSSSNLVDLRLHDVLQISYFSPEALAKILAGMFQLQSFSLHIPSAATYRAQSPPSEHFVLPALIRLDFRGTTQYLEGLAAIIDAPLLEGIEITPVDYPDTRYPKFCEFIDRIEVHKSHSRAHILFSQDAVSISLTQPGSPTYLRLQSLSNRLEEQLYYIARICADSSTFLLNVRDLRITSTITSMQPKWEGIYLRRWRKVFNSFSGVSCLRLDEKHVEGVVVAKHVLPTLHKLYIPRVKCHDATVRKSLVSLSTSRRLSGHPITVEFEESSGICGLVGPLFQHVTIETLSDDILLDIFRYNLVITPRFWPILAFVCKKWREVVLTSPLSLNIRLHCTHGTPVLKAIECWPAFPIVIQYGGLPSLRPPASKDDDNIIAALKQSGRVRSISLTVPSSLIKNLSSISEPLSELEELILLTQDDIQLTLPPAFRWGSRLRTLHVSRIAIPSLPLLLAPSQGLMDVQLHEIPGAGFVPPEAFANALSGMAQLQSLTFHLLSFPRRRSYFTLPPLSGGRVVLPALTCLKYRGTSKYLDGLVARIDAPQLGDLDITFFSQPTMDTQQLGRFIERIEMHTSFSHVEVENSAHAISINFTNSSASTRHLRLQISCKQLDWQLSSMSQVCGSFSPFLSCVSNVGIKMIKPSSDDESNDVDGEQWLELVHSLSGARNVSVAGEVATDILGVLRPRGGTIADTNVLPVLQILRVRMPDSVNEQFRDAVQPFITSRWLSGRPVELQFLCHICGTRFTRQQGLKTHLVSQHAYRIMCSYCDNFEHERGQDHLYRDHVEGKHPEVARNDELFSNPFSTLSLPSELEALVNRHSSLRAPVVVAPSTAAMGPHSQ